MTAIFCDDRFLLYVFGSFKVKRQGQTSCVFLAFQNSRALRLFRLAKKFRFLCPRESGGMFGLQKFVELHLLSRIFARVFSFSAKTSEVFQKLYMVQFSTVSICGAAFDFLFVVRFFLSD